MLDDWLRERRPDVTDDHGRKPLLATSHGRIAPGTIAKYIYEVTRPCWIGNECPHDRDPDDCEATTVDKSSECPSSVSPHAIRRGSITHHLNSDVPETAVGDRANVSPEVLEKHYDQRSKKEKMEQRREYLDDIQTVIVRVHPTDSIESEPQRSTVTTSSICARCTPSRLLAWS